MRRKLSYIIISLYAFLALGGLDVRAQSEWTTYEYSASKTIKLSGNVYITKPIVIKSGATIIIENDNTGNTYKISNGKNNSDGSVAVTGSTTYMFKIEAGATLKIMGSDENTKIILDGGAGEAFATWSDAASGGGIDHTKALRKLRTCVLSHGTFSMDYACIQNVCGMNSDPSGTTDTGGAISVNGKSCGPTIIDHSIIRFCVSEAGSAILFADQRGGSLDPENDCKVTIRNSTIHYCHSRGGEGGTIRTFGSAVSNLHLYNNIIEKNRAKSGAGLYWNAKGHNDTKCTIDKCIFRNNYATDTGGGMMLETSFEFINNKTEVYGNHAGAHGGGIGITGYNGGLISGGNMDMLINDKLKIYNNTSGYGGGLSFYFGGMSYTKATNINVIINGCEISDNTATENGGAISFRNYPNNYDPSLIKIGIKMEDGTFENNEAGINGGGIYVLNTDITHTSPQAAGSMIIMKGNKVTGTADNQGFGGGLYLNGGSLNMGLATLEANSATRDGGGIYIKGGSLDLMKNTVIQGNTAGRNGAGLWIDYPNKNALYVRGNTKIANNTAERTGGGVFINAGNFVVVPDGNLEVTENSSKKGGGAYVIGTLYVRGVSKFANNKVTYDSGVDQSGKGGGVFISSGNLIVGDTNTANSRLEILDNHAQKQGGGVHVNGGDININSTCKILRNRAGYNPENAEEIIDDNGSGGAISVTEGKINIAAGEISNNYAAKNGGAVYANNTGSTTSTIELSGAGVYKNNSAQYGGGMHVGGNIKMTFAGSFISNKATNGGGLFLTNGAQLTITGGFLRQNKALGTTGQARPNTGYKVSASNLHGIGGGVYLNNGKDASNPTKLIFALTGNSIGIYDNSADWGADDVYASGTNTSVTLPNINQMTITDFETPANTPLYWAEDYITNDPNYGYGTKEKSTWDSDKTNDRYDFALKNSRDIYHITFGDTETSKVFTEYMSHQVGYELIFVTLVKKGLNPGENAVFNFTPATKKISDTVYEVEPGTKPYQNVIFVCKDSNQTTNGVVKRLAIPSGWWKIDETSWSWAYTPDNGSKYDKPVKIDADHKEFEFKNVRNANTPRTDEAIVENEMKSSVTVYTASEE